MNQRAGIHGAQIMEEEVEALAREGGGFRAKGTCGAVTARTVLLATGVINNRPDMPDTLHWLNWYSVPELAKAGGDRKAAAKPLDGFPPARE